MSDLSPTLSLQVKADYASLEALKIALKELQTLAGGAKNLNAEYAAATRARALEEVAEAQRTTTKLNAEAAKRSASKVQNLEKESQASLNAESRLTQMLITQQVKRDGAVQKATEAQQMRLLTLERKHQQDLVAEAYRMNAAYDAVRAKKLETAQAENLRLLTLERKHQQEMVAEAYKMNAAFDALRQQRAEKDIAYNQMELSRQIKLRREIAAAQMNPNLGAAYVASKFAPAAIADTRPISAMDAALAKMSLTSGEAANGQRKLNDMMREGHSLARGMAGPLGAMWLTWGSLAPLLAGAGITAGIAGSIRAGSEFEMVLARIQGVSGETAAAVEGAGTSFMKLSENSIFAAKDVAQGAQILVQAGLSLNDALATLPTVLQLASVGELDMAKSAEIATGTMNAFGLEIANIPGIANVLSKAADISQTNIGEIGEAMKQGSTIAKQYNISLIDMSAGIASLAQVNIRGSAAGTAFKNMLTNLAAPTRKGAEELSKLGVSAFDAEGRIKSMPAVFTELSKSLKGLSEAEKAVAINDIFTERGAKGAINYMNALDSGKIADFTKELYNVAENLDYLQQKQDLLNETVGAQGKMAYNSLTTAMIEAFNSNETGLLELTKSLKAFVQSPEFKEGLKALVSGFVNLTNIIIENRKEIGIAIAGWIAYKTTVGLVIPVVMTLAKVVTGLTELRAAVAFVGWSGALMGVRGASLALLGTIPGLGLAIAAAGLAWYAFSDKAIVALDQIDARVAQSANLLMRVKGASYSATEEDADVARDALNNAKNELAKAKKEAVDINSRKTTKNVAGQSLKVGENAVLDSQTEENNKTKIIKALNDVQAAQYNADLINKKLTDQKAERDKSAAELANALKGKPQTTATTNYDHKGHEQKGAALLAKENEAKNVLIRQAYDNEIAMAKQQFNFTVSMEKSAFDAKQISREQFFANSEAAYEKFAATELAAEEKLQASLLGSAREGEGALSALRKQAIMEKAADQKAERAQAAKFAAEEALFKAQLEAKIYLDGKAARLDRLNSEAATKNNNVNDEFNRRFKSPATRAAEDARVTAEKAYQAEIEKTAEKIREMEAAYNNDAARIAADTNIKGARGYIAELEKAKTAQGEVAASAAKNNAEISRSWKEGATRAITEYIQSAENSAQQTANMTKKLMGGMEDALVSFVKTGKLDFKSLAASIIDDLIRIQIQQQLTKVFSAGLNLLTSMFSGSPAGGAAGSSGVSGLGTTYAANGLAFEGGNISRFANGGAFTNGIVDRPTRFNIGEMGEAGPEAIMPLTRDSSGKLGVRSSGGDGGSSSGGVTVVIHQTNQIDSRTDQATIISIMSQAEKKAVNAVMTSLQRGGEFAREVRKK
jgi:TP901 family phage tail tape measure protein/lambda family phage tail tape measure protein